MSSPIASVRKFTLPTIAVAAMFIAFGSTSMARADSFMLSPDNAADVARATAPVMSEAEKADFLQRFYARREALAATAVPVARASPWQPGARWPSKRLR